MTISLYDAIIPAQLQIIAAVRKLVDKAKAYCEEQDVEPEDIIGARLIEDMQPFSYQVKCCREHSLGAIEAVRVGVFTPSLAAPPTTWEGLYEKLDEAKAELEKVTEEEMAGFVGQPMEFRFKERVMPFTAEHFLLSFAQPNFYFHATTAYDLLRERGFKIGKMDFIGMPRIATPT
ncbi:DUF1993 domain-containing protein [Parasphingorhabdus halotolerans]|uniref:DUF1993 domain-containing protein n=1 Tax=Parasphingorhabdus halotolerans TaxID=2725558 RepID=A0A6H2DIY8_9SPHN|nr:DUF1993 domain-containing protein [Parasphingorhabdus halotolerans]QJB68158.1 DUF1993 domain-containing protein [Parasphingorhabdus halotolerans]